MPIRKHMVAHHPIIYKISLSLTLRLLGYVRGIPTMQNLVDPPVSLQKAHDHAGQLHIPVSNTIPPSTEERERKNELLS